MQGRMSGGGTHYWYQAGIDLERIKMSGALGNPSKLAHKIEIPKLRSLQGFDIAKNDSFHWHQARPRTVYHCFGHRTLP
jgi:hypothetical protein